MVVSTMTGIASLDWYMKMEQNLDLFRLVLGNLNGVRLLVLRCLENDKLYYEYNRQLKILML